VLVTATDYSIVDIWIGWKVVEVSNVHNIYYNSTVQMESYMDEKNDSKWKGVNQLIDSSDRYANVLDKIFYSAGRNRPKDYIIENPGPIATFRYDNIAWNFETLA
jgi:hypothetical protein